MDDQIKYPDVEVFADHGRGRRWLRAALRRPGHGMADAESLTVLVPQVTQATNDKQHVAAVVEKRPARPEGLNHTE
jgi:hypothetical protein